MESSRQIWFIQCGSIVACQAPTFRSQSYGSDFRAERYAPHSRPCTSELTPTSLSHCCVTVAIRSRTLLVFGPKRMRRFSGLPSFWRAPSGPAVHPASSSIWRALAGSNSYFGTFGLDTQLEGGKIE